MHIRLADVRKEYATRTAESVLALAGTTATVESGEFVSLVGPSGCGKTTLLNVIAGLIQKSGGTVELGGVDIAEQHARPGIVFQQPVVLPWRTSVDNVLLPAELGRQPRIKGSKERARLEQHARDLIRLVGLGGFEDRYPDELSGGMKQRLAIARALLLETSLVLMDEPFSALDEFTREQMNVELLRLWDERRFTAIFVTHNIFEATFLSDRVLVMTPRPGRVVADVRISLPRPRTPDMIGSPEFAADVRRIRDALERHWSAHSPAGGVPA